MHLVGVCNETLRVRRRGGGNVPLPYCLIQSTDSVEGRYQVLMVGVTAHKGRADVGARRPGSFRVQHADVGGVALRSTRRDRPGSPIDEHGAPRHSSAPRLFRRFSRTDRVLAAVHWGHPCPLEGLWPSKLLLDLSSQKATARTTIACRKSEASVSSPHEQFRASVWSRPPLPSRRHGERRAKNSSRENPT
jgi:hypothetical protein